jgi:hypothetical protein
MPPYNTRSAARRRALEPYKNATPTPTPSATSKRSRVRWADPLDDSEEVPTLSQSNSLESEDSLDRAETPDQDDDDEFQRSPTVGSVEIPDEPAPPVIEDDRYGATERAVMERMFAELQEQKRVIEERAMKDLMLLDTTEGPELHYNPQARSNRPTNPKVEEVHNFPGPKLPRGVIGFGRNGTWVVDDVWQPEHVPSTTQLPSIRESEEKQEVQKSSLDNVTREDVGRNAWLRELTPLPSFVTGNGARG